MLHHRNDGFGIRRSSRAGLTLVELLVVIAIIGVLAGLLLPAVQQARSAGRKASCSNNIRELASAVQQFHERNNFLPTYWGSMNGRGEGVYGGWLLHLLPDLGYLPAYEALDWRNGVPRLQVTLGGTIRPYTPPNGLVQQLIEVPVTMTEEVLVGTQVVATFLGGQITEPIYETRTWTEMKAEWITVSGTPALAEIREEITGTTAVTDPSGVPRNLATLQAGLQPNVSGRLSFPMLQCLDDPSVIGPSGTASVRFSGTTTGWALTNYQANAHAFMLFGEVTGTAAGVRRRGPGRRIISTTLSGTWMGGRFPRADPGFGATLRTFAHGGPTGIFISGAPANSLNPRRLDHIRDGTSNTIMFGEAMRQCDGGLTNRVALLPSGNLGDEHAFGIDTTMLDRATGAILGEIGGYGNTLMFQVRPGVNGCNKLRVQANHGDALIVAMCDGSVRAISASVSRREQCDPDVGGRLYGYEYGYHPRGMGAELETGTEPPYFDGVWDMLMLPTDGQDGNVLANTGEIGNEN